MIVTVKLREYLDTHAISAYRVVQETHGRIAERTVYALARQGAKRVDLQTLGEVIGALRRLTGKPVTPNDLLEVIEESITTKKTDSREWLDGAALAMSDRLTEIEKDVPPEELAQWHGSFKKAGKPVKYNPKKRAFVGQA